MGNRDNFEVRDLRAKSRFYVDNETIDSYAKYIGIYSLGVYLSLCRHSNKEQKSWPSIGKIAEELNVSIPMVHGAIWTLETLNIIKKRRVGKMTCNRYWLLDKKEWISLTVEAVDKLISDINPVNITYKRRLHHLLTTFTSSSKETKSKETKSKANRTKPDASNKPIKPVDNFPYPKPTEKQLNELTELLKKVARAGVRISAVQMEVKNVTGYYPPPVVMIKACRRYLLNRDSIRNGWAWFLQVIKSESGDFYADLNVQEHQRLKKSPSRLGDIMSRFAPRAGNGRRA